MARTLDLDPLRAGPHRVLNGATHGSTERDPPRYLLGDLLRDQGSLQSLDLESVHADFSRSGHLLDLLLEVLHLGRSEEHTSELQSLIRSSYAVFCLKKK